MIPCEHETEIVQALAAGEWSDHVRQHTEGCESCRLTVSLFSAMKSLSRQTETKPSLPYYRWILVQARMQRESALHKKLQRISLWAVGATIAASVLIITGLFSTQGYSPASIMRHLTRTDISMIWIWTALWFISEFQLRTLFKPKLQ